MFIVGRHKVKIMLKLDFINHLYIKQMDLIVPLKG